VGLALEQSATGRHSEHAPCQLHGPADLRPQNQRAAVVGRRLVIGTPEYVAGYSNAAAFLASGLSELGRSLDFAPRAFFAASEVLLPSNRRIIEEALKCRVWNHYGQMECACSITEQSCGRLHLDLDYSHVEFEPVDSDQDGNVTAEPIATNLHNRKWPLLRYRTGDFVTYHPDDHCTCGHWAGWSRKSPVGPISSST
jgi:phenylacetate-coenzyme A ligase PaaK-like adenylate-forming protein